MTSQLDKGKCVAVDSAPPSSKSSSNAEAHFIDDNWTLHKKILNFCQVADHKGETIGRQIETCLLDWGIESVFTVIVDNASSNDGVVFYLSKVVNNWNGAILGGQNMHLRTQKFKAYAEREKISSNKLLCLDVVTRWNSTFFMLEAAEKYEKVFDRLELHDAQYILLFGEFKANELVVKVRNNLHSLYEEYKLLYGDDVEVMDAVNDEKELEVDTENHVENPENESFDVLDWWKINSSKYPILSYVARDILAMPVSTVASESAFSTGGRVLDPHRCSLSTRTVEALICTQNWLRSTPINLDEAIDEIEHIEIDVWIGYGLSQIRIRSTDDVAASELAEGSINKQNVKAAVKTDGGWTHNDENNKMDGYFYGYIENSGYGQEGEKG
ncbi:hypothetical protein KPL70_014804 [Citrus sinensis]|nr:hypothetical protein KPL70_014804 [Citrus sinensis]